MIGLLLVAVACIAFYIYIYMRLPMIVLDKYFNMNNSAFVIVSLVITLMLSEIMFVVQPKLDKIIRING